ncbi:MAG TPA: chromate efflux transporter [Paracoccaceae bacterium]|nr:chromate efflux transporter [Paracoccaceae bacterium]
MQDRPFPGLSEAARVWARIGLLSFGGPAGQIAMMHRILVEENRWLGEKRFLHALNYCMLLPGPEAIQLAIYIGWLMHRTAGGIVAGLLFLLPGVAAILALSIAYALYGSVGILAALFFGLKAAVLAIVVQAVIRIGSRVLHGPELTGIAAVAFVAIFAFDVPFPVIVLGAGLAGWLGARAGLRGFHGGGGHGRAGGVPVDDADTLLGEGMPAHAMAGTAQALRTAVVFLVMWLAPVGLLFAALGPGNVFAQLAGFFSMLAVVTFGGAYAVLAWVAQEAVSHYGWLAPGEMLDGLGLAETTPGPLILVTQFVGFLAAFRDAGGMAPVLAGTLGAALTTWVTFTPCFLWIFLGAPYIERLRGNLGLSAALTAITAAVVGVILNLAVWFALHVVFGEVRVLAVPGLSLDVPVWSSLNLAAALLSAAALAAVLVLRWGTFPVLAACGAAGLVLHAAGVA